MPRLPNPEEHPTVPLWPVAGQAFGLGRARSFELARRGELPFPVYRVGRSYRVPTAALRRALQLDGQGDEPEDDVGDGAGVMTPSPHPEALPTKTRPAAGKVEGADGSA